jgi:tRNA pseudouridine38-40 synthase
VARYKSIVAYDGTAYRGFQRQTEGTPTVQGSLEAGLADIGWQGESLLAAGRTDAGVHAAGQVIAFDLDWDHPDEALTAALNSSLPGDIAIWHTQQAEPGFHPRFDARLRRYRYRLIVRPTRDPLRERYAWRVWTAPELSLMQPLAAALAGSHDFAAFGQAPISGGHTVRTVHQVAWRRHGDELLFEIAADAFLQHMVRRLVAASLAVGSGRVDLAEVEALIDRPDLRWEGRLAPPQGLCLMEVRYGGERTDVSVSKGSQSAPAEI